MAIFIWLLGCQAKTDTANNDELVCLKYEYCCTSYCEAEGNTTYYGEPNPCDCAEDYSSDPRECIPSNGECQWVNE